MRRESSLWFRWKKLRSCEAAAITHGHPSGYYSAGCFAAIVYHLTAGRSLPDAIELALRILENPKNSGREECAAAVRQAVALRFSLDSTFSY